MPYRKSDAGEMDTEGNMPLRIKVTHGGDASEAEGNGIRVKVVKDGADDDTEGNATKLRP